MESRPLVRFTLSYVAGTILALTCRPGLAALAVGFLCGTVLLVLVRKYARVRGLLFHVLVVVIAAGITGAHPRNQARTHRLALGPTVVEGVVKSDPDIRPLKKSSGFSWRFQCDVSIPAPQRITVFWYGSAGRAGPQYGETWRFAGDAGQWQRSGTTVLHANTRESRRLSACAGWSLATQCYAGRRTAAEALSRGIKDHPEAISLLNALLLGYRGELSEDTRKVFTSTGTLHIFAISGLHVGLIALLITSLLRLLRISRTRWVLALAPLLILYVISTGAKASAVRACIMAILFYLAPFLGRRADGATTLAVAALLLLAWNPLQLLNVGFIYTFVVVAGLLVFYPRFERPLRRLWEPDPMKIETEPWWVRELRRAGRYLCGIAALSLSAWLVSAPLTAYFFGRLAPIAVLGNILVVPLAFAIVFVGCLSLILGACSIWVGIGLNCVNLLLVNLLLGVLGFMAAIPLASFEVPSPPLWLLPPWYLLCFFLTALPGKTKKPRAKGGGTITHE